MDFIKLLVLTTGLKSPKKVCKNTIHDIANTTFHPQYWYTHTDLVYATHHRIELKNNILRLLLLTIMTKNHSCYWSSLVQHSHFS